MTAKFAVPLAAIAACIIAGLAPLVVDSGTLRLAAEILLVFAMAQMWNLLAGYAGLLSLGHAAFIGLGGYVLYAAADSFNVPIYGGIVLAFIITGLVSAAVAPLLFRLNDAYFAIGTWVFAEIVHILVTKTDMLGGASGLPLLAMRTMDMSQFPTITFWCASAIGIGTMLATWAIMRARLGLALVAVRDNAMAAASAGVNVWRSRFAAFVLSGAVCGAAGATYFMSTLFIDPNAAFDVNWTVILLFIVIVGGIGTLSGPVIGTAIYFALRQSLLDQQGWFLVLMGGVAVLAALLVPRGIAGRNWLPVSLRARLSGRFRSSAAGSAAHGQPSAAPDARNP
jgi:branched-chain amino acid transport system permease protein